jgi:hypothetical protein
VTVELGPGAASELYQPPAALDELWLGRFLEPALRDSVVGQTLAFEESLEQRLSLEGAYTDVLEASGRWRFERRLARDDEK